MKIATFHTHFGAMNFLRQIKKADGKAVASPVPRALSASCGVCVRFGCDFDPQSMDITDLEKVYAVQEGNKYCLVFENEE